MWALVLLVGGPQRGQVLCGRREGELFEAAEGVDGVGDAGLRHVPSGSVKFRGLVVVVDVLVVWVGVRVFRLFVIVSVVVAVVV